MEEIKKILKEKNWYRQAAEAPLFYVSTPAIGASVEIEDICLGINKNKLFQWLCDKDIIVRKAKNFLRKAKENKEVVDDYILNLNKNIKLLDSFFEKLTELDKKNKEEINDLLTEFDKLVYFFWTENWIGDMFDPEGHQMLKKEIDVSLNEEEIETLTLPRVLNFMEKSELGLCQIAKEKDEELILTKLKEHTKKFFYINNSWGDVYILTEKDFLEPLKKIQEQNINEIIEKIKNKEKILKEKSQKIIEDKTISQELQNVFHLYRKLAEIRDLRKKYTLLLNHYYDLFAQRLSEIYQIKKELVLRAKPSEFINYQTSLKEQLLERENSIILVNNQDNPVFSGDGIKEIINFAEKSILNKFT